MLHASFHSLGWNPPYMAMKVDLAQVAPLASPERDAVRARNRKHNLAGIEAWDASTISSAEPAS